MIIQIRDLHCLLRLVLPLFVCSPVSLCSTVHQQQHTAQHNLHEFCLLRLEQDRFIFICCQKLVVPESSTETTVQGSEGFPHSICGSSCHLEPSQYRQPFSGGVVCDELPASANINRIVPLISSLTLQRWPTLKHNYMQWAISDLSC